MKTAVISKQGGRPEMEDAHFLDLDFGGRGWVYGGIYDGHNGDFAARYAAENVHKIFSQKLLSGFNPGQAFTLSYESVSRNLSRQVSGTTAVDFFIRNQTIFTSNVGDARAIMVRRDGISQLTVDHRVDDTEEKERVLKSGASINYPYVVRGSQGLMPTRSLGDEYFKPVGVIAVPSINEYRISEEDLLLIMACDGLWDFMSNGEVAALAREYTEPQLLLDALANEVLVNRLGTDNLTMIAVSTFV